MTSSNDRPFKYSSPLIFFSLSVSSVPSYVLPSYAKTPLPLYISQPLVSLLSFFGSIPYAITSIYAVSERTPVKLTAVSVPSSRIFLPATPILSFTEASPLTFSMLPSETNMPPALSSEMLPLTVAVRLTVPPAALYIPPPFAALFSVMPSALIFNVPSL